MASFNTRYLKSLLEQLNDKEKVLEALNAMAVLAIPLSVSTELCIEAKVRPLIVAIANRKPIRTILSKLAMQRDAESKRQMDEDREMRAAEKKAKKRASKKAQTDKISKVAKKEKIAKTHRVGKKDKNANKKAH